jgi:acetyl-CoA acetyltransferase
MALLGAYDAIELSVPVARHMRDIATPDFAASGTVGEAMRDTIPRKDTSLERLARLPPAFDRVSGKGTSSPLTDGAASLWVASDAGLKKLPAGTHKARLIDWEIAAVDHRSRAC